MKINYQWIDISIISKDIWLYKKNYSFNKMIFYITIEENRLKNIYKDYNM